MNKKIIGIFIMMLLTTIAINLSTTNVIAEDPPENPTFEEYFVEGNGTYFEITNSSYLNITLTSSENISILLESYPRTVSYLIESNCTADSTFITLTGFMANITYYMCQDGQPLGNFTPDENGSYSYTQDLSIGHYIDIQENASTITINPDGSIEVTNPPYYNRIQRVGLDEYWLTEDIYYPKIYAGHTIRILRSDMVLDGRGHIFEKYPVVWTGNAVALLYVNNVTIRNFSYLRANRKALLLIGCTNITIENITFRSWSEGISIMGKWGGEYFDCNNITITNCDFPDNGDYSIFGVYASNVLIKNNTIDNHPDAGLNCGIAFSYTNNLIIDNCSISNAQGSGIWLGFSNDFQITNCEIFNNSHTGISLEECHGAMKIFNNTISGTLGTLTHDKKGIRLQMCSPVEIYCNNISNNDIGIFISAKGSHIIYANTIEYNGIGIQIYNPNPPYLAGDNSFYFNNIIENVIQYQLKQTPLNVILNNWYNPEYCVGNYWSDYIGEDLDGDGVGDTLIPHPYSDQGNGYYRLDPYPLIEISNWCIGECVGCNEPPVADANGPYNVSEGSPILFNASGSFDPDDDSLQYRWDFNNDGVWDTNYSTDPTASYTWHDDFTGNVTVEVYDGDLTDTSTTTVTVSNVIPVADAGIDHTGDEPSTFTFTGSHTDPGILDTHTYEWDFDYDGVTFNVDATGNNLQHTWEDDFNGTVALRVTDDDGGWHIDTCNVIVGNVAPTITSFCLPIDPLAKNTPVDLTASFTDPGILDTHTATINWGDGNTTNGNLTGTSGTYNVSSSWTYSQAGVYTITLSVEDDDGGNDTEQFRYVVVYDPSGGFVTGGGWINSPEGAYKPDLNITGKANFGFVSKYKQGQSTPTGNTQFNFKVADLNFHSKNYDWLVIAGAKAMYKGTGTINNEGSYKFILSAIDEDKTPSIDIDMFRIKIWEEDNLGNEIVIYDNNIGDDDLDSDPETQISGGNIVIHNT